MCFELANLLRKYCYNAIHSNNSSDTPTFVLYVNELSMRNTHASRIELASRLGSIELRVKYSPGL